MQLMKRISFFVVVSVVPIVESTTIVIVLAALERSGTFTAQHTGRYHYLSFQVLIFLSPLSHPLLSFTNKTRCCCLNCAVCCKSGAGCLPCCCCGPSCECDGCALFKVQMQCFCLAISAAFPCDEEVPPIVAVAGLTVRSVSVVILIFLTYQTRNLTNVTLVNDTIIHSFTQSVVAAFPSRKPWIVNYDS